MVKQDKKTGGFLLKQRAFLKLYLLEEIEKQTGYGLQFLDDLRDQFRQYGYVPSHSELYKILHKLSADGIVERSDKIKGDPEHNLQRIVLYRLTDKGKGELELFRKQMKKELERCIALLEKAIRDHY